MYILYGHAELFFPYCSSLKEKRKTLQSIIARVRKRFNISICEVNYHDLWQRSALGFTAVCNSYTDIEPIINAIHDTLDQHLDLCEITDFKHNIYNYDYLGN